MGRHKVEMSGKPFGHRILHVMTTVSCRNRILYLRLLAWIGTVSWKKKNSDSGFDSPETY